MRRWLPAILAVAVAAGAVAWSATPSAAGGDICYRLWFDRNAIYKTHGYCFHSYRARSQFSNYGCAFWSEYDVPLSYRAAADINHIVALEHQHGCRGWAPWGHSY